MSNTKDLQPLTESATLPNAVADASQRSIEEVLNVWQQNHSIQILRTGPLTAADQHNLATTSVKEDTSVDYPAVETNNRSFVLGISILTAGSYGVFVEKSDNSVNATTGDAADSQEQKSRLPRGIQNVRDLQEYGIGIGDGLQNTASRTLQFLSQRNSVNNLLRHMGQQFTQAVDYYSKQPSRLLPDTRTTLNAIGQSAVDNFGHPLPPRLAGEYTSEALTFFLPMGAGGKVLSEEEVATYGGERALKAMSDKELAVLKLTRIEPDEGDLAARIANLHLEPKTIAGAIRHFEETGEVSPEGLEQVGRYLRLFEHPKHPGKLIPKNEAMLNRLLNGERSHVDLRFYYHELAESQMVTDGCLDLREAHLKVLNHQGIIYEPGCEIELYHPNVIRRNPSMFDPKTVKRVSEDL